MKEPEPYELNGNELDYREYAGVLRGLPELLKDGRVPLSIQGMMERRLEVMLSYEKLRNAWWDHDFTSGDVSLYHPDGRMKIILDCEIVKDLGNFKRNRLATPIHDKYAYLGDSHFTWGLSLPLRYYESLEGEEFSKEEQEIYGQPHIREKKVIENPIWRTLARDTSLLKDYARATYILGNESIFHQRLFSKRSTFKRGMGIKLESSEEFRGDISLLLWALAGFFGGGKSELYHPKIDNVFNGITCAGSIVGVK